MNGDEPVPTTFRLAIDYTHGPNGRLDRIILYDDDPAKLAPEFVDVGRRDGPIFVFERYRGEHDHDYVEIRADLIVTRSMSKVAVRPESSDADRAIDDAARPMEPGRSPTFREGEPHP